MYNMEISLFGYKFRVIILILIVIIFWILFGHLLFGCCSINWNKNSNYEGFTPANTNFGESSKFTLGDYSKVDTYNWGMPNMVVTPGKPINKAVRKILDRDPQEIPLPNGQLSMFANTPFKPECCPNTYSNSSGCACMTTKQYNYLIERGSNNVPYSEY